MKVAVQRTTEYTRKAFDGTLGSSQECARAISTMERFNVFRGSYIADIENLDEGNLRMLLIYFDNYKFRYE